MMQNQRFKVCKKVGSGSYGSVYKCFDNKIQKTIALKKIKHSSIENHGIPGIILREISILMGIDHPNIIKLLDVLFLKEILLVFDYMEQNLQKFLREKGPTEFLTMSQVQVN